MLIDQLLDLGCRRLGTGRNIRIEAELLLGRALEVKRSFLYANPGLEVPDRRKAIYLEFVRRRQRGEPVAYLLGRRAFWTLDLIVTPAVMIPRPETELLVEKALSLAPGSSRMRVADLGTGSGAIALALASERPAWQILASDISHEALAVAAQNAERHGIHNVEFVRGSWAEPLSGKFDLVVANPPYVPEGDPHLQRGDCRFEPVESLCGGPDGLTAIRDIARSVGRLLNPQGWLLLEHGFDQGEPVRDVLASAGLTGVTTVRDLEGRERITLGREG